MLLAGENSEKRTRAGTFIRVQALASFTKKMNKLHIQYALHNNNNRTYCTEYSLLESDAIHDTTNNPSNHMLKFQSSASFSFRKQSTSCLPLPLLIRDNAIS